MMWNFMISRVLLAQKSIELQCLLIIWNPTYNQQENINFWKSLSTTKKFTIQ